MDYSTPGSPVLRYLPEFAQRVNVKKNDVNVGTGGMCRDMATYAKGMSKG